MGVRVRDEIDHRDGTGDIIYWNLYSYLIQHNKHDL